jgi:predicted O-methyltransferase YrrM
MNMKEVLLRRPRIINVLHALRLASAQTGTTVVELSCLGRYARDRRVAVEIGTHMGVSAKIIAENLPEGGILYCVDPWAARPSFENPSFKICARELKRAGLAGKVRFVRGRSESTSTLLPDNADFIFVDGDHSRRGIETDWDIVRRHLVVGGLACFHDTWPRPGESWQLDSVAYFRETIARDSDFAYVERCETLNVLRRVRQTPHRAGGFA